MRSRWLAIGLIRRRRTVVQQDRFLSSASVTIKSRRGPALSHPRVAAVILAACPRLCNAGRAAGAVACCAAVFLVAARD